MKIGFVTNACPEWSLEEMFKRGADYGYDGLELGLIDGQLANSQNVRQHQHLIQTLSKSSGCPVFSIDSYVLLAQEDAGKQEEAWAEAQTMVELAGELGAQFVRVFGASRLTDAQEDWAVEVASDGLSRLAEVAKKSNVKVGVETGGYFNKTHRVRRVLEKVNAPQATAVWDILHPTRAGESASQVWANVGGRVGYLHMRDARSDGDNWPQAPLGTGVLPVREVIRLLASSGFDGFLSIEWERGQHRELAGPEIALPAELAKVKEYLKEVA